MKLELSLERTYDCIGYFKSFEKTHALQIDPTVMYGLDRPYGTKITYADLRRITIYNTYVIPGLPPEPICFFGRSAWHAALHPEKSSYYYYLSKGNGQHAFSKNLDEHRKMLKKYILKK